MRVKGRKGDRPFVQKGGCDLFHALALFSNQKKMVLPTTLQKKLDAVKPPKQS
jgi:hypothetical protein